MRGNRVWAEINLSAIRHNVKLLRRHLAEETKLLAVVKADGYGHGALPFAWTAIEAATPEDVVGGSRWVALGHVVSFSWVAIGWICIGRDSRTRYGAATEVTAPRASGRR